jgi:MarR family transcriptional regulator for hemolysin
VCEHSLELQLKFIDRNSEPKLLQLLTDAQSGMARLFENRARHLGLTRPQWRVLAGLHGNDGITQTALSEITSIARSPLGKIVDQLERKHYIERRGDADDRRINRLYLTVEVTPLVGPARELAAALESSVLEGMPESTDITELLAHLTERLKTLGADELRSTGSSVESTTDAKS